MLEAIANSKLVGPYLHEDIGANHCPVNGLYQLNMRQAFHYGLRTSGRPGRHHTTLLHWAVYWERAPLVEALVKLGADPTIKDGWGGDCAQVCGTIKNQNARLAVGAALVSAHHSRLTAGARVSNDETVTTRI